MKSIFTITFLVTLLLTAGTALSYECYEKKPPQIRPCTCSQCVKKIVKKPQCRLQHQPCPTRCDKCDKCDHSRRHKPSCQKKVVHQQGYQCKTTCTKKTEQTTTVQCKLCGIRSPKDIEHYCNRVQCKSCDQIHPRDVEHRCGMTQCKTCGVQHPQNMKHHCGTVRCRTCGVHHPQDMKHRCGETRCQSCGIHYQQSVGHHCRPRSPHQDCSQGDCFQKNDCQYKSKQCATRGCNLTSKESKETMETRWHAWFKNQG